MSCSFNVKDGKLINLKYEEGDFDCSWKELASLEECPEKIEGSFSCSGNQLTSLEGCPERIGRFFSCCLNQLTSLKGCPKKIKDGFDCSYNSLLTDISDLPSNCQTVRIEDCPEITKFPNQIEGLLKFECLSTEVRKRIKQQPFYEVIEEGEDFITVRQKTIGEKLLDSL